MLRNNINILSNDGNVFKYVVDSIETDELVEFYTSFEGPLYINDIEEVQDLEHNLLTINKLERKQTYKASIVNLYGPEYKMELFDKSVKYLVQCFIEYGYKKVCLHSSVHDWKNALANNKIFNLAGTTYYEHISFKIPDVKSLLWSDKEQCVELRDLCENESTIYNAPSTVLNIVITPLNEDNEVHSYFGAGSTAIQVTNDKSSFLEAYVTTNVDLPTNEPCFCIKWRYNNKFYNDIKEYILETYYLSNYKIKYTLSVHNNEDLWETKEQEFSYDDYTDYQRLDPHLVTFDSWDSYTEGSVLDAQIDIISIQDDSLLMSIKATPLELTQDVFKYFVEGTEVKNINLSDYDMNNYTFNTVNKIVKQVIQVDRPKDYKANIIKPVFYKVKDAANIIINPDVTENICINLDSYKSKTEVFFIQIEGVIFNEVGRTSAGVIFKVVGHQLPGSVPGGTYYILDSKKEMVTSGKYTYNK